MAAAIYADEQQDSAHGNSSNTAEAGKHAPGTPSVSNLDDHIFPSPAAAARREVCSSPPSAAPASPPCSPSFAEGVVDEPKSPATQSSKAPSSQTRIIQSADEQRRFMTEDFGQERVDADVRALMQLCLEKGDWKFYLLSLPLFAPTSRLGDLTMEFDHALQMLCQLLGSFAGSTLYCSNYDVSLVGVAACDGIVTGHPHGVLCGRLTCSHQLSVEQTVLCADGALEIEEPALVRGHSERRRRQIARHEALRECHDRRPRRTRTARCGPSC